MRMRTGRRLLAAAAAFLGLACGAAGTARAGATLDAVKARGQLYCGVHTGIAGFAIPDGRGVW